MLWAVWALCEALSCLTNRESKDDRHCHRVVTKLVTVIDHAGRGHWPRGWGGRREARLAYSGLCLGGDGDTKGGGGGCRCEGIELGGHARAERRRDGIDIRLDIDRSSRDRELNVPWGDGALEIRVRGREELDKALLEVRLVEGLNRGLDGEGRLKLVAEHTRRRAFGIHEASRPVECALRPLFVV